MSKANSTRSAEGGLAHSTYYREPPILMKMNRTVRIDSKLSLDAGTERGDSSAMLIQPYHLHVERVDPDRNVARFYTLAIEPTLFGTPRLLRRWGRIGTRGQVMVHHFEREEDAVVFFLDLLRTKRARGYRTRPIGKISEKC